MHRPQQVCHVTQRGTKAHAGLRPDHPAGRAVTDDPPLIRSRRPTEVEVTVGADDGESRLGLAQPLHQLGDARCLQQRRIRRCDRRFGLVDPVDDGLVLAREDPVEGQVHPRRHDAQRPGLGAEVGSGGLGRTTGRVEVTQGGQGQRPARRPVGQRLLHHSEVAPLPHPAHQWRGDVVEARFVQRHHEVHIGPRRRAQPREHQEVTPVSAVEGRDVSVVTQDRHRPRTRRNAPHRGQQQAGQLGVTRGVGADGQSVLVVEQAQRSLLTTAEEVRLVRHTAQSHHDVRPPLPDAGDDVDQTRAPRQEHRIALNDDLTLRRDMAQTEPRLRQRAQGLVALGRHSGGRSSRARSNHKNP